LAIWRVLTMNESAAGFHIERLGLIMQADPARPEECEGVLNPAAARGPDGALYLFPRLVGQGNYSRVGIARVQFNDKGNPAGVERLGYALEPQEPYELRPGTGGCEDPRVTYVEPLKLYVMAYVAWGLMGPRVALAVSEDLRSWRRLGLAEFVPDPDPVYGVDFDQYHNKDGAFFPRAVPGPDGRPALALLHRPVYGTGEDTPKGVPDPRPSIWMSYCALEDVQRDVQALARLRGHHVLIDPEYPWEELRIGGGTPPLMTPLGWLLLYHGVTGQIARVPKEQQRVQYAAGVLVLDADDPRRVLYRTPSPILEPETGEETEGVVPNVVFPTSVDDRGEGWVDVYYGMADLRIGAARLQIPDQLPAESA
jgi:predicted GH43/DUF377 family glycosyl hydrolase